MEPKCDDLFTKTTANTPKATPVAIIIVGSKERGAEVISSIKSVHSKLKLAKLFARHYKVEKHVEYLKTAVIRVAIGTPNRLMKLVELGALKVDYW
jgi:protein CMS1